MLKPISTGASFSAVAHGIVSYSEVLGQQQGSNINPSAVRAGVYPLKGLVRVIYQAPRSRVRVDTAGEDEAEPQARPSTSWPDPPVHGDEGPDINRVVWSEMNATASGLYGS